MPISFQCRLCSEYFASTSDWKRHRRDCRQRLAIDDPSANTAQSTSEKSAAYKFSEAILKSEDILSCDKGSVEVWRRLQIQMKQDRVVARRERREARLQRRFDRSSAARKRRYQEHLERTKRREEKALRAKMIRKARQRAEMEANQGKHMII